MSRKQIQNLCRGLAACIVMWLCATPSLVICMCNHEGHTSVATRGHIESACETHQHSEPHAPLDSDHSHENNPFAFDEGLPTVSSLLLIAQMPAPLFDVLNDTDIPASFRTIATTDTRGPPQSIQRAIDSTILLV